MSQSKFWKNKPKLKIKSRPNYFAIKSYNQIKNKKYSTLLDLGSGRSRDPFFFARKGYDVTAVEISKNRIQILIDEANRLNIPNIKFVTRDIAKLNFLSNSFDIIYAHLALHYFNEATTEKIFKSLLKLAKKNGSLFIKVKSVDDPEFGKGKKIGKNIFNDNGHMRHFFTKDYLQHLLGDGRNVNIRRTTSIYIGHKQKSKYLEASAVK